jgi:hypothetical protein
MQGSVAIMQPQASSSLWTVYLATKIIFYLIEFCFCYFQAPGTPSSRLGVEPLIHAILSGNIDGFVKAKDSNYHESAMSWKNRVDHAKKYSFMTEKQFELFFPVYLAGKFSLAKCITSQSFFLWKQHKKCVKLMKLLGMSHLAQNLGDLLEDVSIQPSPMQLSIMTQFAKLLIHHLHCMEKYITQDDLIDWASLPTNTIYSAYYEFCDTLKFIKWHQGAKIIFIDYLIQTTFADRTNMIQNRHIFELVLHLSKRMGEQGPLILFYYPIFENLAMKFAEIPHEAVLSNLNKPFLRCCCNFYANLSNRPELAQFKSMIDKLEMIPMTYVKRKVCYMLLKEAKAEPVIYPGVSYIVVNDLLTQYLWKCDKVLDMMDFGVWFLHGTSHKYYLANYSLFYQPWLQLYRVHNMLHDKAPWLPFSEIQHEKEARYYLMLLNERCKVEEASLTLYDGIWARLRYSFFRDDGAQMSKMPEFFKHFYGSAAYRQLPSDCQKYAKNPFEGFIYSVPDYLQAKKQHSLEERRQYRWNLFEPCLVSFVKEWTYYFAHQLVKKALIK